MTDSTPVSWLHTQQLETYPVRSRMEVINNLILSISWFWSCYFFKMSGLTSERECHVLIIIMFVNFSIFACGLSKTMNDNSFIKKYATYMFEVYFWIILSAVSISSFKYELICLFRLDNRSNKVPNNSLRSWRELKVTFLSKMEK